jgi:polyphosphate kinase
MLELKARFDEEANLEWKTVLEEEGITVLLGMPNMKVHAKLCVITSLQKGKRIRYGFVSTGNLNESSAKLYADHCLLTASPSIMGDAVRVFEYLANWRRGMVPLKKCRTLLLAPVSMRKKLVQLVEFEIRRAKAGKKASLTLKVNSLSDAELIKLLNKAAEAGVVINLIVRGIYCPNFAVTKKGIRPYAISIVDEYLEHARVMIFHHGGKEKIFISSADWMVRNIDHRIEAAVEIQHPDIRKELKEILAIQLADNVKARVLDGMLPNDYVKADGKRAVRSQIKIYQYLHGLATSK